MFPVVNPTLTPNASPKPPMEQEVVYTTLENASQNAKLEFHAALKNVGRPPKRALNFGSPTTPYNKRHKKK